MEEPVRTGHQEHRYGREHHRNGEYARLVCSSAEVSDGNDEQRLDDVVAAEQETSLRAAQTEAPFKRSNDSARVDSADHMEQQHDTDVQNEQVQTAAAAALSAGGRIFCRENRCTLAFSIDAEFHFRYVLSHFAAAAVFWRTFLRRCGGSVNFR